MPAFGFPGDDTLLPVPPLPYSPMVMNTDGRTRVDPRSIDPATTLVLITIGQSLMANYVGGEKLKGGPSILQAHLYDGAVYQADDPLLGVDTFVADPSANSNFAIRLGRRILADKAFRRFKTVLILPIAVGGSYAGQWCRADYLTGQLGIFWQRIVVACARLRQLGLSPHAVLWQQGTTDNSLNTTAEIYATALRDVVATFRECGVAAPFLVAQDTWVSGDWDENVRRGQRMVVDPAAGIYPGPDVDLIPNRRDLAHMDAEGGEKQAIAWTNALRGGLTLAGTI